MLQQLWNGGKLLPDFAQLNWHHVIHPVWTLLWTADKLLEPVSLKNDFDIVAFLKSNVSIFKVGIWGIISDFGIFALYIILSRDVLILKSDLFSRDRNSWLALAWTFSELQRI